MEKRLFKIALLLTCFLAGADCCNKAIAQCTTTISTFPYNEGFENSNGNWTVNGSLPSWEWGTPAKPTINIAGGGNKCWTTGNLTNDYYNDGEASWLQSPCFDFTTVQYPYIKMKIWWETERGYDGASLQYSVDNGSTWTNVGTAANTGSCNDSNWYNSGSVRFLGAFGSLPEGWSGSVKPTNGSCLGGNGSGGWVTAGHSLTGLGGKSGVLLRFAFGAGTQCNNYDGFAVDDISITNIPPGNGTIVYNCVNSNTVAFAVNSSTCPTDFAWNFNDPLSGTDSVSTVAGPQHTFSAPGTYNITVTAGGNGLPSFTATKQVTILSVSASITKPVACSGGATGAALVTATASPNAISYRWNTSPAQLTAAATGLAAGSYTVTVTSQNTCTASATVVLIDDPLLVTATIIQPGCLSAEGAINLTVSGGQAPYNFAWQPAVSNSDSAIALKDGFYKVAVKDSRSCVVNQQFTIARLQKPVATVAKLSDADCNGMQFGSARVFVTGGTAPYLFIWDADPAKNKDTLSALQEGDHTVQVIDSNGCTATSQVTIGISGICNEVYFPNSFSPNGDTKNDLFGPLGNVVGINNYFMRVYNRYGQQVFASNNPLIKWDGTFKGKKALAGTYVWQANFVYLGSRQRNRYGTVTIVR